MPKKTIDYSKTIMYKIVHNDLTITSIYIGHTTDFTKRKYSHKHNCYNEKRPHYNLKVYQMIRDKGGWNEWNMILIEEFPCKNSLEACKRERELYEEYHANLNTLRPYISKEEYKEEYLEQHKQYYEENKEQILEQKKQYYEENKQKMLERDKQYYEANKEKISEHKKQYREENKEKISERRSQKSNCPHCNKALRKESIKRHKKICKNNITI